jgi:FMN phosphatase YigB (HAD superfamily)
MAEAIEELRRENTRLKETVSKLEKENALYKKDATYRGYYVQNKIANQQIDILEDFDIETEIKKNPKDDKYFDRAKGLWEGMPDMIAGLNKLKSELKITGNEDKDKKNVPLVERLAETRT